MSGSDADVRPGELDIHLSGRYGTVDMLPLSFSEYVHWTGGRHDLNNQYRDTWNTAPFPMTCS